jgi:hypothetical protein
MAWTWVMQNSTSGDMRSKVVENKEKAKVYV